MDEEVFDEPILFDKKEIARTAQYLGSKSEEPEQADIALDLGGQFSDSAYIAADLFRRGVVSYVLVSGGLNRAKRAGTTEANSRRASLLAEGVPADRIIVEGGALAAHTHDVTSLPKLREHFDPHNIKSMIVISEWYNCRRAVMTLKQHWPSGTRYYASTFEPEGIPRLDWHLHHSLTKLVLKELEVISEGLDDGSIEEIEWDGGAWI